MNINNVLFAGKIFLAIGSIRAFQDSVLELKGLKCIRQSCNLLSLFCRACIRICLDAVQRAIMTCKEAVIGVDFGRQVDNVCK